MRILWILCLVITAEGLENSTAVNRQNSLQNKESAENFELNLYNVNDTGDYIGTISNDEQIVVSGASKLMVGAQVRRVIRKVQLQMPCGFPEYGIPPLAPYVLDEGTTSFHNHLMSSLIKVENVHIDGLNDFIINKLKVGVILSKANFDFLFPNITISIKYYNTDIALALRNEFGFSMSYQGDGVAYVNLKNLRIAGKLRYSMPVLWGATKISSLKTRISLQEITCDIIGIIGDGSINKMLNKQIETWVLDFLNNKPNTLSDLIETSLLPHVNEHLQEVRFWTIVKEILFGKDREDNPSQNTCNPSNFKRY